MNKRILIAAVKTQRRSIAMGRMIFIIPMFMVLYFFFQDPARAGRTNLALNGTATQIDTSAGAEASRAIDGNVDGNFYDGSVTHTASTDHPWWQVDLGKDYRLGQINVWNRTDCCSERLHDFTMQVLDSYNTVVWQQFYAAFIKNLSEGPGTSGMSIMLPSGLSGKIVKIINGDDYLHLAEVQVYAPVQLPGGISILLLN